jgi:hypothetical protein
MAIKGIIVSGGTTTTLGERLQGTGSTVTITIPIPITAITITSTSMDMTMATVTTTKDGIMGMEQVGEVILRVYRMKDGTTMAITLVMLYLVT